MIIAIMFLCSPDHNVRVNKSNGFMQLISITVSLFVKTLPPFYHEPRTRKSSLHICVFCVTISAVYVHTFINVLYFKLRTLNL